MASQQKVDYDVIAIGAGFAGLGLVHHVREAGLSIRVFDKATDIGGTWTWNRYPGAASDSECYYYCLTFSKEILDEWSWSVRYPGWEENNRYMHFVADKCDMWPHIQLNTEINSAEYQEERGLWLVTSAGGEQFTCKYFISAMGMISEPVIPDIKGKESFNGPCFHSARWPEQGLDFSGKRVGIIGTGATTVQMLPEVAKLAEHVTVFQRTPNYVLPAVQKEMTPEWEKEIKDNYEEIILKRRNHSFGMPFNSPVNRNLADTPSDEVQAILEEHWPVGSFRFVFETFDDLLGNAESNKVVGDFVIKKMKERVNDPKVAEMLTPKYSFFAKRPPLDHDYYEAYNRDNVKLVDIKDQEPIVEITESGIRTSKNNYDLDIIIQATGFQAYTGGQEALNIRGRNGLSIREKWQDVSGSIMGVFVAEFPNLFMITGPQAPFANLPTSIEENISYIMSCIKKMEAEGFDVCSPIQEAEDEWVAHTADIHGQTIMAQGDKVGSWMMGANMEDKTPRVLIYYAGANVYYDKMQESVDAGFPELKFGHLGG